MSATDGPTIYGWLQIRTSMSLSLLLCLLSFGLCYWAGRRSLPSGLIAALGVGYGYGIMRANVPETFSHFIFDAGVVGLYATQLFRKLTAAQLDKVSRLRDRKSVV